MKCFDDCHTYYLDHFGQGETLSMLPPPEITRLHFYEMRVDGTKIDGVTNEEVLRVLVHRLKVLDEKFSCIQNDFAIKYLESALALLESRTEDRKARGVEGKMKP
jgi:hypothetical protein